MVVFISFKERAEREGERDWERQENSVSFYRLSARPNTTVVGFTE